MERNKPLIVLAGDIALNDLISETPEMNRQRFEKAGARMEEADLVFANFEFPVLSTPPPLAETAVQGEIRRFCSPEACRLVLPLLHIRCLSLANNHSLDYGQEGLKQTLRLLDELNIQHTGAGTHPSHLRPVIVRHKAYQIGFIAYTHPSTHPKASGDNTLLNIFNEENILRDISEIRPQVDLLILSLHWGKDYSFFPTKEQERQANRFVKAGVDMIMGHHPHTIQPFIRTPENAFVFFSLGSLTYGDFMQDGNQRSLRIQTKNSFLPFICTENFDLRILAAREKKGNHIVLPKKNLFKWNKKMLWLSRLKNRYGWVFFLVRCKENILDRVVNFFFGYYRNPLKDLFVPKNLKKIKYLFPK